MKNTEMNTNQQCDVCGAQAGWKRITMLPRFLFGQSALVLGCKHCGVGRTLPSPATSLTFYENNKRNDDLFIQRENIYRHFAEELLGQLEKPANKKGNLLDFGCGGGYVVEAADRQGYAAEGIEANLAMVDWCRARGLDVSNRSIDELSAAGKQYDVIVFSAVLEHLADPCNILEMCKRVLKPNGSVVISQASYDGLLPRLFPWGWYGWQPREHFWHFTPLSIRNMCQRSGLYPVKLVRSSLHHPWFMKGSVLDLVGRNLAALLARIGQKFGKGDSVYYVFKSADAEQGNKDCYERKDQKND